MSADYSVVQVDEEAVPERQTLEFQDFASGSGVGGKIATDNKPTSSGSFNDPFLDPSQTRNDSQGGQPPMWSIEYYAQFFDVDTNQVLERAAKSLYPKDNFNEVVGHNPDLYGPFWIATTTIFLLFVTSSIAGSIAAIFKDQEPTYDFRILSFGAMAIYSYTFILPLIVWAVLKYLRCKPSLLDIFGLYGYGLTVWLPVSVLCIIPSEAVRWTLVIVGFAISGFFIGRNLYPVISRAEAKTSRIIIIFIAAAHAALAFLMKIEFFSYTLKRD